MSVCISTKALKTRFSIFPLYVFTKQSSCSSHPYLPNKDLHNQHSLRVAHKNNVTNSVSNQIWNKVTGYPSVSHDSSWWIITSENDQDSSVYQITQRMNSRLMANGFVKSHTDPWPPKSNQLIFESEQIFLANMKKFPLGVTEISHSQECGRRTAWRPESTQPPATASHGLKKVTLCPR